MTWRLLDEEEARRRWDALLLEFPDQTVFQTCDWAAYKRNMGWTALFFLAEETGGRARAMALVLAKLYPLKTAVVWCRGGPVGEPVLWNRELRESVKQALGAARLFFRLSSCRKLAPAEASALAAAGWRKPPTLLGGGRTIWVDLDRPAGESLSALSSNWRHNLNRGQKKNAVRAWTDASPAALAEIYESMQDYKAIAVQHTAEDLRALFKNLGARIALLRCDDEAGRPIAFRAAAINGDWAWDLLAASTPEGRKRYASYALLWALLQRCRELGARRYDLTDVDPVGIKGVYDFKKGTGGQEVELLGEWDWASSPLLRWGANWMIGRKKRA